MLNEIVPVNFHFSIFLYFADPDATKKSIKQTIINIHGALISCELFKVHCWISKSNKVFQKNFNKIMDHFFYRIYHIWKISHIIRSPQPFSRPCHNCSYTSYLMGRSGSFNKVLLMSQKLEYISTTTYENKQTHTQKKIERKNLWNKLLCGRSCMKFHKTTFSSFFLFTPENNNINFPFKKTFIK